MLFSFEDVDASFVQSSNHLALGIIGDPVMKVCISQQFLRQIPKVTQKFFHCNLCNCAIFLFVSVSVLQEFQVNSRSRWCIRCLKQDFDIQHYSEQSDVSYPLFFSSCQLELSLEHPNLKTVNTPGHSPRSL